MRSPGNTAEAVAPPMEAAGLLQEGRRRDRDGSVTEAMACYEDAIALAERSGDTRTLTAALRHLAVACHRRGERARAQDLIGRSCAVAERERDPLLLAEALNTRGGLDLNSGALADARRRFLRVLELAEANVTLRARAEQNLGILANIQGKLDEAFTRYAHSLAAYRSAGDVYGCAVAYHNLGMVSADRGLFDEADRYFEQSREHAERAGDVHLRALCLVNHAEVDVACQRFENARQDAEAALMVFDQLGAVAAKADAYRVLGMYYRETGRAAIAESRFRTAIELAVGANAVLSEAEARRELALLYQALGRNVQALGLLNDAYRLFHRLDARVDLVDVGGKMRQLEGSYLALVREWGKSIESADSYTHGHCERVAQNAVTMARALGLPPEQETTILIGAYLHDVGKVRIPHEVENKPGPLSRLELALVRQHPVWGVELLADAEFPWEIKPIIRWHHERYDGTGYPDGLKGEQIPLAAQIVGILDFYDALRSTRSYKRALSRSEALSVMMQLRAWWSERVFHAFVETVGRGGGAQVPAGMHASSGRLGRSC
ncbi:MAG TPA: HD domain-containing phosphohydrolase [Gemmatimonadales bacterium]|nr:HD domain-containing phosphohydrolase [Gemmatimonadales bacterium]